ncbi:MAG: hypothetical protein RQ736_02955 [Thiogranum sp.]|nr:hypothetical protein [Thiogranum sp.]
MKKKQPTCISQLNSSVLFVSGEKILALLLPFRGVPKALRRLDRHLKKIFGKSELMIPNDDKTVTIVV